MKVAKNFIQNGPKWVSKEAQFCAGTTEVLNSCVKQ
jgi:hypothetical protein